MKKLFLYLGIIPLIVLGCSSKPNREQLVGKYCFNKTDNRDSIFINNDNTYKHTYITSDGKLLEIIGNWEFDSNTSEILFKEFMFFNDHGGTYESTRGNWYSNVKLIDDEIRLIYSAENNIYFYKNNSSSVAINTNVNKFSRIGNQTKELNLTGRENVLKLSYDFYKEADELLIYDQKEKELYRIDIRAKVKTETATINLAGVTKLVFKIKGNDT